MIDELAPVEVDFKSAGADFWERYHAYRRIRHEESRPDDPLRPDDIEEIRLKRDSPFDVDYHYEIARDGVLLSWFWGSTAKPGAPGYESNKHLFWGDVFVHPDHRRQRIGASWLPTALEIMERHGCTVAGFEAEEVSGHAFMKWLGAEAKLTGAENRLKIADVDWSLMQRWIDEGPKRSAQTKLEVYDGPIPDALLDDFAPQLTSMLKTIPFESLDIGEILVTPEHIRDWDARAALTGVLQHTVLTREPDGVISSMTDTAWDPSRPTIIEQRFTGVRPDARGRGLGKWIKAKMLAHMHERYPTAEWVVTDNAGSNAPMLAINTKMGFKEFRAGTEYQVSRETLASRRRALGAS
jgi:GNAT superfamily N-acetyltransferase